MDFSVDLLGSLPACDIAEVAANKIKSDLEFKLLSLSRSLNDAIEASSNTQAELTAAQVDLDATIQFIQVLPPGRIEDELHRKRLQLELKVFNLSKRIETNGPAAILERQIEVMSVENKITLCINLIQMIQERRNALSNAAA